MIDDKLAHGFREMLQDSVEWPSYAVLAHAVCAADTTGPSRRQAVSGRGARPQDQGRQSAPASSQPASRDHDGRRVLQQAIACDNRDQKVHGKERARRNAIHDDVPFGLFSIFIVHCQRVADRSGTSVSILSIAELLNRRAKLVCRIQPNVVRHRIRMICVRETSAWLLHCLTGAAVQLSLVSLAPVVYRPPVAHCGHGNQQEMPCALIRRWRGSSGQGEAT